MKLTFPHIEAHLLTKNGARNLDDYFEVNVGAKKEKVFYKDIPHGTSGLLPTTSTDMVNSPPHYAHSEIECIDAMVAAFGQEAVATYCRLAAFKYTWRAGKKFDAEEDLKKAVWYLRFGMNDDPRSD